MRLGRFCRLLMFGFAAWSGQGADNLLVNANFEEVSAQGGFPGWRFELDSGVYAGSARNLPAPEGSRCLELCCPEELQSGAVIQRVQVIPGKEYFVSALLRGKSGFLRVNAFDAEGNFIGCAAQIDLTLEPETYTWKSVSRSFTADERSAYVEVIFDMWARECKGSGYADMLFLGEKPAAVPETPVVKAEKTAAGVTLGWSPCENAARYIVYKSYFPDRGKGEAAALVSGTNWLDDSIDRRAAQVFYRVVALDEAGQPGGISSPAVVAIREFPPETQTYAGVFSPFEKVRKYQFLPDNPNQKITLECAKNESAAAQIVLSNPGRAIEEVGVLVKDLKINGLPLADEQASVELFAEQYTLVDMPSMPAEPGYFPDALLPWAGAITVSKGENQGIWLKLRTTPECPPGELTGTVEISEKKQPLAVIPLTGRVYDFALPVRPSYPSSFQIRYDRVMEAFGFTEESAESEAVMERYVEMLLSHRLNPLYLPYPPVDPRAQKFLRDERLVSLGLPTDDFSRLGEVARTWKRQYGVDGCVYVEDEPGEADFQRCRDTAELVHRNPGVPYLLTVAPNPELFGAVDIWVPSLQNVDRKAIAARRAAGERVWWYTSLLPCAPFPTLLVDDCGTSPRALAWLQVQYGIEGLLYWDIAMHKRIGDENAYCGQVWDTPLLYEQGNGDGFLVYPGKQRGIDGPVTSIRLEALLEGLEELEYFALYRRLLREKGVSEEEIDAKVGALITPAAASLTRWSANPELFDVQRRKLAAEILKLRE